MNTCVLCGRQFEPALDQSPHMEYCSDECLLNAYRTADGRIVDIRKCRMSFDEHREMERAVLNRLVIRSHVVRAPEELLGPNDPKFEAWVDEMYDALTVSMRCEVLGEHLEDLKWPADWWQAFKERWFPGWAKERWPVRYDGRSIEAIYPKVSMPSKEPVIIVR